MLRFVCWSWVSEASFGHGVIASPTERIAAQNTPHGENETHEEATFLKCLKGIGRAGWCEPAAGRFQRRYKFSVKGYEPYHQVLHKKLHLCVHTEPCKSLVKLSLDFGTLESYGGAPCRYNDKESDLKSLFLFNRA